MRRTLVGPVCFALFGWLTAARLSLELSQMLGFALFGALFAFASACVISLVLFVVNHEIGLSGVWAAVGKGFLMMIPFAVLAVVAEVGLHWNAVQAFASVGLMSAGAAAGMELAKINGKPLANGAVPALSAVLLALVWAMAGPLAVAVMRAL